MQNEKKYFASANTEKGFISYYSEIYGNLERLYVIKGGPGTGKSHFIRSVADEAEKNGYSLEYFYCSSDPLSLDGIIIKELQTGVIDGTAPHIYEPCCPGVTDKIVNLGDNWDESALKVNAKEIRELTHTKDSLYNNAYNYLGAAGRIESEIRMFNRRAILFEKMQGAANRLAKSWKNGKGFYKKIRPIEGISHTGRIVYDTYLKNAENAFVVKDRYGIGYVYLDMLLDIAKRKSLFTVYSPGATDTSNAVALYFPEISFAFVICDDDGRNYRQINMDRFVDIDILRMNKQKNRFARRCLSSLYEGAQKTLDEIFEKHALLEKYYAEAMDFSRNALLENKVKQEIFL